MSNNFVVNVANKEKVSLICDLYFGDIFVLEDDYEMFKKNPKSAYFFVLCDKKEEGTYYCISMSCEYLPSPFEINVLEGNRPVRKIDAELSITIDIKG